MFFLAVFNAGAAVLNVYEYSHSHHVASLVMAAMCGVAGLYALIHA